MKREPRNKQPEEFSSTILDLARVTRVTKGGKHLRFRACVGIGDKKGRVGIGVAKGNDVSIAVEKAKTQAKKNLIKAPIINGTIPHAIEIKFKAAKIFMKPAAAGVGVKAGGVVRILCDLAGITDISAKILGSKNKINNAKAVMKAFGSFISDT